jgi:GAF domain-containing protein
MKGRSKASGEPVKGRSRKALQPKRRNAPKAARHSNSSLGAREENEVTRLTRELNEARQERIATADILRIISSSSASLDRVFKTLLENATRICDAKFGIIFRVDGEAFVFAAGVGTSPDFEQFLKRRGPFQPEQNTHLGRIKRTRQVSHTADYAAESAPDHPPVKLGGARSTVDVPMLKDDELIGAFSIYRQEVRPFTDKQIELVKNFAAQAVIAIENARLLNELRQRTDDLTKSLEQQTATSEVLRVISSSPGDLEPVFRAMLANAVRICDAKFGNIYRWEGDALHLVASHDTPAAFAQARRRSPFRRGDASEPVISRLLATKAAVHIADAAELPGYLDRSEQRAVEGVELGGARTVLAVPMLRENEVIGSFTVYRQEVRPFTDKQIDLVNNFASQAVIAIENARLLNDLREALQRQTATSEVLGVISKSPGDLAPVYQAILENATRICEAKFGVLNLHENGGLRMGAMHNVPTVFAEWLQGQRGAYKPITGSPPDRVMRTKQVSSTADNSAEGNPGRAATLGGARSTVCVPMLKDDELVGTITIYRQEVRPFTDTQIDLLKDFASQAVIAIENARLLNELRERTEEVEKLNQHLEQRVADQVGEIERMGRLRRFLPPQVADLIVASGTQKQLESHRREITALFCDLRGFTGFSESSDPEDVMALLRDYHAAIGEIIVKYSGTLERYAGDGVMVVFNDPVPVENPALQAVLMALEMRDDIGALTDRWRRLGHDIGFGIGIAHGFATLGTIGFEGRFDYAAIGTVSNVASRLCDEAKPGQILISPRVLMTVEDAVKVEPVGEFTLKGIRRPLAAYNVLSARTVS